MNTFSTQKGSIGSFVAIGIIVIIVVIGALYLWGKKTVALHNTSDNMAGVATATASRSDELDAIEQDLKVPTLEADLSGLDNL